MTVFCRWQCVHRPLGVVLLSVGHVHVCVRVCTCRLLFRVGVLSSHSNRKPDEWGFGGTWLVTGGSSWLV